MILGAADFHRSQGCQMRRQELRVKQQEATRPQPVHQIGQRSFRRVGAARKHAFAEKCRP